MANVIKVENFKGLTDLPLYNRGPEWCDSLVNMRVMPGGYLEARGGFEKLKPSGGTATDPITAGIFTGAHEHAMADGWILTATTGGTVFSANLSQRAYYTLWGLAAATANDDAIYVGANSKFSRVVFYIGQGTMGATPPTFAYEYYNGTTWTALTTTSTPSWEDTASGGTTGEQTLEFAVPSDWAATPVNSVLQYWVRARMSAENDGFTTASTQSTQKVFSDWAGMKQLYLASSNAAAASNNGRLMRYDQSGTTAAWTAISTALFSGNFARARFASYRGNLYLVNGKDQKRWDNNTLSDMGFTEPTTSGFTNADAGAGNLNGTFNWAVTYGYGPAGEWGESNEITSTATGYASRNVTLTFNFTNLPASGLVDVVYVYRTPDLAAVPAASRGTVPYYRIATVTRDSAGAMPTTYTDSTAAFPFPPVALDITTNTPPARCKFITVHKNRMFLGNNNQFAGRVWWSEPFEAEAFNQDENYADFTRSTGGQITGMAEFNDQVCVFTEDSMFGIANVDQDQPSIYVIHPGVGCVAPDSIAVSNGVMMWLARDGVYLWTGEGLPARVTNDVARGFGKLSLETFGGSRAIIHNRLYDLMCMTNAFANSSVSGIGNKARYDLVTQTWSQVTLASGPPWGPLITITAPLGHADAGVRHPLYGQTITTGTDYAIYIGEYTTADNDTGYLCKARINFGPKGYVLFSPAAMAATYNTDAGWGTPSLSFSATGIYTTPPTVSGGSVSNATNWSVIQKNFSQRMTGTQDLYVDFSVTSAAGGTVNGQRLLSMYLTGNFKQFPLNS